MARRLEGEVAIVTGAGRGFGRAIAERFAREGAAVALTSRTRRELDEVAGIIKARGGRTVALPADITAPGDVQKLVHDAERLLGPLTLIVSNAGVPWPFGPMWVNDPEQWWAAQEVHIKAPMLLVKAAFPGMVERKRGRLIIVSAVASHMTVSGLSAYITGKTAQRRMGEVLAYETREHGVSVFSIDPGFVFTQLAQETMTSPDAQRYLPQMVEHLKRMKAGPPQDADLERCASRCVALASGRYDALSGSYSELPDDLDKMLVERAKKSG